MALDLDFFRKKLEEEKARLEGELGTIAHRNPDAPEDWTVSQPDMNVMPAAKEEVADVEEELENAAGVFGGFGFAACAQLAAGGGIFG